MGMLFLPQGIDSTLGMCVFFTLAWIAGMYVTGNGGNTQVTEVVAMGGGYVCTTRNSFIWRKQKI